MMFTYIFYLSADPCNVTIPSGDQILPNHRKLYSKPLYMVKGLLLSRKNLDCNHQRVLCPRLLGFTVSYTVEPHVVKKEGKKMKRSMFI
jgi:hypothetical protein